MKLPLPRRASAPPRAAFTLTEVLLATTVFSLLVGGVLCANLFGLRMFGLAQHKLSATDDARAAIGRMADEIRNAKSAWIGQVTNGVFVGHLDGEPQTGNGVLLYPTPDTNSFVIYFVNPADQTLRRTTSAAGTTTVLARSVANSLIFRARDYLGHVLTNNQNQRLIHTSLEFFQPQSHLPVPDSYRLETAVARRAE